MDQSRRNYIILAVVVVCAAIGLYFIVGRMGAPTPTLGPGQTLQNPFGNVAPHGGGAGGPSGGFRRPVVPAPGTSVPGLGAGPSKAGPFRVRTQSR